MATGWLTWTCLLLAAGAPGADDVVHMNQRGLQIPISIKPERQSAVRELILYMSTDKGQHWGIHSRALPTNKAFEFFAPNDGLYYFSVAVTDQRGVQEPPDISKSAVGLRIHVDTKRPEVKILQAERVGDEIQVSWEARDESPDWAGFKLEWRAGDLPGASWTPLPIQPSERGNHRFRASAGDVSVKVTMRDLAGNEATEEKLLPVMSTHHDRAVSRVSSDAIPPPPPPPSPVHTPGTTSTGPAHSGTNVTPLPVTAAATSVGSSTGAASTAVPAPTSPLTSRGALPPLQIVRQAQVKLGFDVSRYGSSGLGSVDVYVTADEGETWEKSTAEHPVDLPRVSSETSGQGPVKGTVTVELPKDEVIIGYYLVVKSRAGLGKQPPQRGDKPHVRLERDTKQPMAELHMPQPDSARPSTLLFTWRAEDRNLAANPVTLEWSPGPNGPWTFIGDAQLPNTGRFNWQVPPSSPPKVYLKLTVRDSAGNVAVAQTSEAILIDLTVPELGGVTVIPGR
jgi:hypothetical protein